MNDNQNIKFMVFDEVQTIENYIVDQICQEIRRKGKINLSIESRMDFSNIYEKLKEQYLNKSISFKDSNFFMADEFIFDENNWRLYEPYYSSTLLQNTFFNFVDFKPENIHKIVTQENFYKLFTNDLSLYDSIIDAHSGIDLLIIKMHANGSLIFNEYIDDYNLNTKAVHFSNNLIFDISKEFNKTETIPHVGVTLGIDQIMKAKKIIIIAIGQDKNQIMNKIFFTKYYDKKIPMCLIKDHPSVLVLSDNYASNDIFAYNDKLHYMQNMQQEQMYETNDYQNSELAYQEHNHNYDNQDLNYNDVNQNYEIQYDDNYVDNSYNQNQQFDENQYQQNQTNNGVFDNDYYYDDNNEIQYNDDFDSYENELNEDNMDNFYYED